MYPGLRHLPNLISSLRILLVVPLAWTLLNREFAATLVLFVLAAGSDAADGFLAKRFGWQSVAGALLDPIADKLLLATSFVMLTLIGLVPPWLTAVAVARDAIIVSGAIAYRVWIGPLEAQPSLVSKLNTLCQVLFILAVVGQQRFELHGESLVLVLGALTFLTAVISGIDYVLRYGRRAYEEGAARRRIGPTDRSGLA